MWVHGFECARAVRSLVCVPCFVLERGVWIPALMSWVSVSCRGSDTRAPFSVIVWVCGLEFPRPHALLSTCVLLCCTQFVFLSAACIHVISCAVARSLCISWTVCFHVVMSCVNTWLMSFLISCMFVSCFAHGWWIVCWPCTCVFVLCEHVASVLVFCVPHTLMSICLDPTHLVTCLWINFPQLLSLVNLLICSLYNLLVFAVPCGFVAICQTSYALCPALPCPFFPYRVVFACFVLLLIKAIFFLLQLGPRSLPITRTWHSLPGYTALITFL